MWWVYAILSAVFAALTAIFAKAGLKDIDSNLATALRTVIILVITWGVVAARGTLSEIPKLTKDNLLFIVLSGVATCLSWLFYFAALQKGKVSEVAPVDKASVPLAILLSVIFLGEALSWKLIVGGLLVIVGTIVIIL